MTRRDYLALAAALRSTRPVRNAIPQYYTWSSTCQAVADALEEATPKDFNRFAFLAQCGVTT